MPIKSRTPKLVMEEKEAEFLAKADLAPGEKVKKTMSAATKRRLARMDPNSKKRGLFSLRPNAYQLALLQKAAKINKVSMQNQAMSLLIPALERIVNMHDKEAISEKQRAKLRKEKTRVMAKIRRSIDDKAMTEKLFEVIDDIDRQLEETNA